MQNLLNALFSVDSIWSFVLQAVIWFVVCFAMIISTDVARPERSYKKLKQSLGLLLMFIFLSGGLLFILFGRSPMPTVNG
ncbi:MAG TPA: hypothetical protein VJ246_00050 [Patescibacteria group bacterium]|nr:hypothetical protein [Patescibacteria group bacterium]